MTPKIIIDGRLWFGANRIAASIGVHFLFSGVISYRMTERSNTHHPQPQVSRESDPL